MSHREGQSTRRELRHGRNNEFLALRLIARALGGEVVGGQVLCPGPPRLPRLRARKTRVAVMRARRRTKALPATSAT
jgi:hypothetical protein